ncbi:histidine kinase [Xanthomonas campestris]|uniref:sensor histidine kinase n=1 Tax=Xanthomonas campestris TaxID=339 RepID=UPI002B2358D4|nr:histidine kinase [Xanthomonas campestris]MEA9771404.1 histidine kinase [Xanthomonas campestris pv. raphani]MEA9799630.1 histidine kinase [Xanthomonas campestris pv. raphani]MEA9830239.1 histidine kinase [Xanthomonas campestris pv. raphani]MEA9921965.1 histidine kinase [Xanthomonas campestris pv. raphani]MEA9948856.1 histidine kinase [Xanthomonas campestris pv. raphani]
MTNAAKPSIARTDRLDALAQPSSMVWLLTTGECIAAILAVTPGYTGNRWVYFGLASLGIQWVLLLTLASLLVLRRLLAGRSALTVACTALALMQLVTAVISTVMFGLFGEYWHLGQGDWKEFSVQLSVIAFLIAVLGMGALHNHLRLQQMAIRAKQAELDALTARVQPHFLFNTLNMAIALLHARPQQAEQLLLDLSELFRAALTTQDKVPLADEIELTKRYLEIEALRFGERLSVRWDLPTRLPEISVPNLTLQPLVENAVHHGIEGAREGGEITIAIISTNGLVEIHVHNSVPAGASSHSRTDHGIGLSALRGRLEGSHAMLSTEQSDTTFRATITLRP